MYLLCITFLYLGSWKCCNLDCQQWNWNRWWLSTIQQFLDAVCYLYFIDVDLETKWYELTLSEASIWHSLEAKIWRGLESEQGFMWQLFHWRCWRRGFDPWVRNIPWRRKRQPTPVFLPGKPHGQRSLAGYSLLLLSRFSHVRLCTTP